MYGNSTTSSTSHYLDLADLSNLPSEHMSIDSTEYLVYNVPGDGDCFFHSLSLTLHGHTCRTQYYRDLICGHIVDNWMLLETMVKIYHHPSITQHEYMRNMQYGREWATGCEIKIASLLLSHQIDVYYKPSNNQNSIQLTPFNMSNSSSNFAIEVLLYGQHFQVLRRFGNQGQIEPPQTIPTVRKFKVKEQSANSGHRAHIQPSPIITSDHSYAQPLHVHVDLSHHDNEDKTQPPVYIPDDHNYVQPSDVDLSHRDTEDKTQPPVYIPDDHNYVQPSDVDPSHHDTEDKTQPPAYVPDDHNYAKTSDVYLSHASHFDEKQAPWDNTQVPFLIPTDHTYISSTPRQNDHDYAQIAILGQDTTPGTQSNVSFSSIKKMPIRKRERISTGTINYQVKKAKTPNQNSSSSRTCTYQDRSSGNEQFKMPISSTEHTPKGPATDSNQYECRKLGVNYEMPPANESTPAKRNRTRRNLRKINAQKKCVHLDDCSDIPAPPCTSGNKKFDDAMDAIRAFELRQMSYSVNHCTICHERRIEMQMAAVDVCKRCNKDSSSVKMLSSENNMNPGEAPSELQNLTIIEQQLISRISPCMNVHLLKHGGIASSGHCVTFPQEVNEPAQIFPRLPEEINIIKVRKQGQNGTSKEFRVQRHRVQNALLWLKQNNPAYSDIIISQIRIDNLPVNGDISSIHTIEYKSDTVHQNDQGPAPQQLEVGDDVGETASSVLLPDQVMDVRKQVENIVHEVVGDHHEEVTMNTRKTISIPWPSRDNIPISEFTTRHFFTMAFPALFPYGTGDFHINRPRTCESLADWADHLMWFEDGRFANHQYFKFVVHNMIMRKRAIDNSNYIVNQQLGDKHITIAELKEKLQSGDTSIGKKILYFGGSLRGTAQYWTQKAKELRALVQFKINEGSGLPSFFTTGSCAEYHFKPLKRLLTTYIKDSTNKDVDLDNRATLFQTLQGNSHIVAQYFDLRTQSYFRDVMGPVFGVDTYWYRQEFAKSRGMIHWHGLCWRKDKEPHNLLHEAIQEGLSEDKCAQRLSEWASTEFGMSASHPAGKDDKGNPRKDLWPPPEGSAPAPPEELNPLVKLLMDVGESQENILEDYLLLTNRINLHRCSDYCLRDPKSNKSKSTEKQCRMEFGTLSAPGKTIRNEPSIVLDKNGSKRLEMARDHPMLVQHSRFHTQGWRANGDISLILSKNGPDNPSVNEIIATQKYITGYACKGNQPTGAVADLFNDMVNCADESTGATSKSLVSKLLMGTVKRDISAVEASHELSSLPLYRSNYTFQNVSLSGARVLQLKGNTLTKNTVLDRYLSRHDSDNTSLYKFLCRGSKVPVVTGNNTQASWPLAEDYSRTMLLLHWPQWRNITDIKDESTSWVSKMQEFLQSNNCPNFVKADVERARKHIGIDEDESDDDQLEDNELEDQPEWMDLVKPNPHYIDGSDFKYDDGGTEYDWSKASHDYPKNIDVKWVEKMNASLQEDNYNLDIPDVNINNMNDDQELVFNIVMATLKAHNEKRVYQPLRLIVAGTAGSGKSYLIQCLVKAIRTLYNTNKSVQVVCPTGNSANIISGKTIHSFLKIPTRYRGREMKQPTGTVGLQLQENCTGVNVLLVDERSMVGATTLGWMEFMCRCGVQGGKHYDQSWGGIPVVVFFGDDVQLPPVLDAPVYNCNSKVPAAIHGVLVWQEFKEAVTLETIIRQDKDEQALKNTLLSLREYKVNKQQVKWLQQFQWDDLGRKYGPELLHRMQTNAMFVFPSHAEEWVHNKAKLLEINETFPIAKLNAVDQGSHAHHAPSDKAGGLQKILYLCKHAKVMLSANLCVPYGLYNGANGTIADIIYPDGKGPHDGLPSLIMVEFPNYKGPAFMAQNPKLIPIVPIQRTIDCSCHFCKRTQIPLRLGWATTIHRCQGMTIGAGETNRYIVISPGTRQFEARNPGALFVALSRARSAGGPFKDPDFAWHPRTLVNEDRLCFVVNTNTSRARTKEIYRISSMSKETTIKYSNLKCDVAFQRFRHQILQDPLSFEE